MAAGNGTLDELVVFHLKKMVRFLFVFFSPFCRRPLFATGRIFWWSSAGWASARSRCRWGRRTECAPGPAPRSSASWSDRSSADNRFRFLFFTQLSPLFVFFSSIFNPLWTDLIGELFESYWIHIFRKSFKKTPLVCRRCGSRCSFAGSASATRRRRRRTGRPRRPSSTTPNWWDLFRSAMLRCFFKPLFYVFDRQLDWVKLGQVTLYLAGLGWVRFVWVRLG